MAEHFHALVIDDDPIALLLLKKLLSHLGFSCQIFTDAHQGINYYQSELCKIVMIDYYMPNISGTETANSLEKIRAKKNDESFFIGMSSTLEVIKNNNSFKFDAILEKPIKHSELSRILKTLIPEMTYSLGTANEFGERNIAQINISKLDQIEKYFEKDFDKSDQIRQIFELFFSKITKSLVGLNDAMRDSNLKETVYHSHSLKNASSRMGAEDVFQICSFIETNASTLNRPQLAELISDLKIKCDVAKFKLKQEQIRRGY